MCNNIYIYIYDCQIKLIHIPITSQLPLCVFVHMGVYVVRTLKIHSGKLRACTAVPLTSLTAVQ